MSDGELLRSRAECFLAWALELANEVTATLRSTFRR